LNVLVLDNTSRAKSIGTALKARPGFCVVRVAGNFVSAKQILANDEIDVLIWHLSGCHGCGGDFLSTTGTSSVFRDLFKDLPFSRVPRFRIGVSGGENYRVPAGGATFAVDNRVVRCFDLVFSWTFFEPGVDPQNWYSAPLNSCLRTIEIDLDGSTTSELKKLLKELSDFSESLSELPGATILVKATELLGCVREVAAGFPTLGRVDAQGDYSKLPALAEPVGTNSDCCVCSILCEQLARIVHLLARAGLDDGRVSAKQISNVCECGKDLSACTHSPMQEDELRRLAADASATGMAACNSMLSGLVFYTKHVRRT
jgi:hypothetical protein